MYIYHNNNTYNYTHTHKYMSDAQYSPYRKFNRGGNEEGLQDGPVLEPFVAKVKYNIGTEILMLKRNLHNSTLRGHAKLSLSANHTIFCALYDQLGPWAVGAT